MEINQKICIGIFSILIGLTALVSAVVYYRSKKTTSLYAFLFNQLLLIFWLYFGMIEKMSSNLDELLLNVRFTLPFSLLIGPGWLFYAYHYWRENNGLSRPFHKQSFMIFLPTLLFIWPIFTHKYFYLIIESKTFGYASKTVWGSFFNFNYIMTMSMLVMSLLLILKVAYKKMSKWKPLIIYGIAVILPWGINVLAMFNVIESPGFDLTPVAYFCFSLVTSWLILRYQFLDVIPDTIFKLINEMTDSILMVNSKGDITFRNEMSKSMFGDIFESIRGNSVYHFFDLFSKSLDDYESIDFLSDLLNDKESHRASEVTYNFPNGNKAKLIINIAEIFGSNDKTRQKLIAFKDVTIFNERILDAERNRVSYDLHDSLGNDLNAIRNHLEYVIENLTEDAGIKESINISYERTTKAFLELKRIVDTLNTQTLEDMDLVGMLNQFFKKATLSGLKVSFSHQINEQVALDSKLSKDLYFICQEALTNAVIHGKAQNLTVSLIVDAKKLLLYIIDDGIGASLIQKGHGLTSMEKRLNKYGGLLAYGSPTDGGFNIKINVPI